MILPNSYEELKKPPLKNFGLDLRKIFRIAVRKYVAIYEKINVTFFVCFYPQILMKKSEKILDEKCRKLL
jgi:hypothetical protein